MSRLVKFAREDKEPEERTDEEVLPFDKMLFVRTGVLLLALMNQFLVIVGLSPIPYSEEEVGEFLSLLFTVAATIWVWWKDNDVTKEARKRKK